MACVLDPIEMTPPQMWSRVAVDGDERFRGSTRTRSLDLLVDPDELVHRQQTWSPPPPRYTTGALAKYAKLVGSAAGGAVCGQP